MNKKGGFTDLFIFMIVIFVVVLISGVFIYMSAITQDQLHASLDDLDIGGADTNVSEVIDDTFGDVVISFQALYWLSILLIFGMIIAIFIGSYMVTTKPIFFIPYLFVVFIAVTVAVPMSNAYEMIRSDATLGSTFAGFIGSNFILNNLPMIMAIVGITGGIIMFSQLGKKQVFQ